MKPNQALSIVLCTFLIALSGCCKSGSSPSVILSPTSYTMSATITKPGGSSPFSALGPSYVSATETKTNCIISASDTSGMAVISNFTFTIAPFHGAGTYVFDSTSVTKADYETSGIIYTQTSFAYGTIVLTQIAGENISGTFFGTLTDGSVITGGKFTALGRGF